MNSKILLIAAIGFAAGVIACGLAHSFGLCYSSSRPPISIAEHWRVVEHYRDFCDDPSNYRPVPGTPGLSSATLPPDPEPSLAALVLAGELEHVDLVLPNVPQNRETNRLWMERTSANKDFLHAYGNPSYADFEITGTRPLHLRLWFRSRATADLQRLIRDLEQLARVDP